MKMRRNGLGVMSIAFFVIYALLSLALTGGLVYTLWKILVHFGIF